MTKVRYIITGESHEPNYALLAVAAQLRNLAGQLEALVDQHDVSVQPLLPLKLTSMPSDGELDDLAHLTVLDQDAPVPERPIYTTRITGAAELRKLLKPFGLTLKTRQSRVDPNVLVTSIMPLEPKA